MAVFFNIYSCAGQSIHIAEGKQLLVRVDPKTCHWSAELKGTDVKLDNISFLEGDNPNGWKITSSINRNDSSSLGNFETVTLHGTKKGQLDFDYHLSVSKTGNDIIVSLDRANHTGKTVEVNDLDYLVADNARLGGIIDQWVTFGTRSIFYQYYDLTTVRDLRREILNDKQGKMYEVCLVARDSASGNSVLMGHLTVNKGHSRFGVSRTDNPSTMQLKAWCSYNVTMPNKQKFTGEKLLIHLGNDPLRGLEHLGGLIGKANNINLKEKRPYNLNDTALISLTHCAWSGWSSGGTREDAQKFIKKHGLDKFYYGAGGPAYGKFAQWGLYYCGGNGSYASATDYPKECYLQYQVANGNGRVIDFSNPLSVKMEKERVREAFSVNKNKVNMGFIDMSHDWDKWPGQYDPYMSAAETWHAGAASWRDAVDSIALRMRNKACVTRADFNYGYADLQRVSGDADGMYVRENYSSRSFSFLSDCVPGAAARFLYNTRVFWNDGDSYHVFKYSNPHEGKQLTGEHRFVDYGKAKVIVNYLAISTTCMNPAEAFDCEYPEDRIQLMKRVAPPTTDAGYPVDLFVRKPAQVWNMPVERPFGKWNIVGIFNFGPMDPDYITAMMDSKPVEKTPFSTTLDAQKDLRLDPNKEYIVYEFWSKKMIGTFKGAFTTQKVKQIDCDMYSIVEKQEHPVLVSTSRHVRQMAFDIKDMKWDEGTNALNGVSRAVGGDPYQLRIFVPDGWYLDYIGLPAGLMANTAVEGNLLTVDYMTKTDNDVEWEVFFKKQTENN